MDNHTPLLECLLILTGSLIGVGLAAALLHWIV